MKQPFLQPQWQEIIHEALKVPWKEIISGYYNVFMGNQYTKIHIYPYIYIYIYTHIYININVDVESTLALSAELVGIHKSCLTSA